MICDKCFCETNKLIASGNHKEGEPVILKCRLCFGNRTSLSDRGGMGPNLHQNTSNPGDIKVTVGKAFEIDHRFTTPDGEVRNRKTGAMAQY